MNEKRRSIDIDTSASFSPEENTLVWNNKYGSIKKNMDSSLLLLLPDGIRSNDGPYTVIQSWNP